MIFKRISKKSLSIIKKASHRKNDLLVYLFEKWLFKLFEKKQVGEIGQLVSVISAEETLFKIEKYITQNQKGVYMRFGDGDIFLLKNTDDRFQKSNALLSIEMKESLSLQGQNVFKCLAIHSDLFGYSDGMIKGNHKVSNTFAIKLLKDSYKYFIGSNIYSPVALHFVATKNPIWANNFLKLLKSKIKIFIGNENVKEETLHLLFGKDVVHIKTPSKNAYDEIDRVENEALDVLKKNSYFSVVCVAMGCSGRPFMKRIWENNFNVFLFDFGSLLDGIEGNKTRTWLKINEIDYDLLLKDLDKVKNEHE